jgi:N-acetylneuraminate synthase
MFVKNSNGLLARFIEYDSISSDEVCHLKRPKIIAEAGVNHEGSLDIAKRLIDDAAEGGADAIKFQTYRAHTIASKHSPSYWDTTKESTKSQYELFKKYDKFWKSEYEELKAYCDTVGIEFLSTPFDTESATFLNDLMGVYKISSSDITNKPFIEFLCDFNKPIILSTGASTLSEIDRALAWIDAKGLPTAILHCVLSYPTSDEYANLLMIRGMKKHYPERLIGYSDHTLPADMRALETAWLLGARIIEKHFTHDKKLLGNDHYHAMDKQDLAKFIKNVGRVEMLLGKEEKQVVICETEARRQARRSLVAKTKISSGTKVTTDMLTWKRPAHGICPSEIDNVVGQVALQDVDEDELLTWEVLE